MIEGKVTYLVILMLILSLSVMKFIADVMLGKLARWLRILGYDAAYDSTISDNDLILRAKKERRILLTMDTGIVERCENVLCVHIDSPIVEEQIKQVVLTFKLDTDSKIFQRCTVCNTLVKEISKSNIKTQVPTQVFETNEQFWRCPNCKRIYWQGSHLSGVKRYLSNILK